MKYVLYIQTISLFYVHPLNTLYNIVLYCHLHIKQTTTMSAPGPPGPPGPTGPAYPYAWSVQNPITRCSEFGLLYDVTTGQACSGSAEYFISGVVTALLVSILGTGAQYPTSIPATITAFNAQCYITGPVVPGQQYSAYCAGPSVCNGQGGQAAFIGWLNPNGDGTYDAQEYLAEPGTCDCFNAVEDDGVCATPSTGCYALFDVGHSDATGACVAHYTPPRQSCASYSLVVDSVTQNECVGGTGPEFMSQSLSIGKGNQFTCIVPASTDWTESTVLGYCTGVSTCNGNGGQFLKLYGPFQNGKGGLSPSFVIFETSCDCGGTFETDGVCETPCPCPLADYCQACPWPDATGPGSPCIQSYTCEPLVTTSGYSSSSSSTGIGSSKSSSGTSIGSSKSSSSSSTGSNIITSSSTANSHSSSGTDIQLVVRGSCTSYGLELSNNMCSDTGLQSFTSVPIVGVGTCIVQVPFSPSVASLEGYCTGANLCSGHGAQFVAMTGPFGNSISGLVPVSFSLVSICDCPVTYVSDGICATPCGSVCPFGDTCAPCPSPDAVLCMPPAQCRQQLCPGPNVCIQPAFSSSSSSSAGSPIITTGSTIGPPTGSAHPPTQPGTSTSTATHASSSATSITSSTGTSHGTEALCVDLGLEWNGESYSGCANANNLVVLTLLGYGLPTTNPITLVATCFLPPVQAGDLAWNAVYCASPTICNGQGSAVMNLGAITVLNQQTHSIISTTFTQLTPCDCEPTMVPDGTCTVPCNCPSDHYCTPTSACVPYGTYTPHTELYGVFNDTVVVITSSGTSTGRASTGSSHIGGSSGTSASSTGSTTTTTTTTNSNALTAGKIAGAAITVLVGVAILVSIQIYCSGNVGATAFTNISEV